MARQYRFWEKWEEDFIKENLDKLTIKEIAQKLNRTEAAVAFRAKVKFETEKSNSNKRWQPQEDEYIKKHYKKIDYGVMADELDRSANAIRMRVTALGLVERETNHEELDKFLILNFKRSEMRRLKPNQISLKLGIKASMVLNRIAVLGLEQDEYAEWWEKNQKLNRERLAKGEPIVKDSENPHGKRA